MDKDVMVPRETEAQDIVDFATDFVEWLIVGKYKKAHSFLSISIRESYTVSRLRSKFEAIVEGDDLKFITVSDEVYVDINGRHNALPNDIGSVYVPIYGDYVNEAVFVVINMENGNLGIREIEWGRP